MNWTMRRNDLASIELEARRLRAEVLTDSVRRIRDRVTHAFGR